MGIHNSYLIAISALFVLVFVIMLYSLIRHVEPGETASRFGGPTGRVQWLWALVPMAILGAVNLALIEPSGDHKVSQQPSEPGKIAKFARLEIAAVRK